MANYTKEQHDAIDAKGRVIVSASAGSGKTTVMIEKIIRLILNGAEVADVLAVTFTKKAASQMKDKLKRELIKAINSADTSPEHRETLKKQLSGVAGADISTIHSFCAKLIRTHFFEAGVSGEFKIVAGDDAESTALKNRALDKVFEDGYEIDKTDDFFRLLSVYFRKKSDKQLREIILTLYNKLRERADYRKFLERMGEYTEADFDRICEKLHAELKKKCVYYASRAEEYEKYFNVCKGEKSEVLAKKIKDAFLEIAYAPNYFTAISTEKASFPRRETSKSLSEEYVRKIDELIYIKEKKYQELFKEFEKIGSREKELCAFLETGKLVRALAKYILLFDKEYTEAKRERSLLDYNDLEHVSLDLLQKEKVREELRARYTYVFVDEYQDVNPVQEKLISLVGGENVFLVGDVKQAIYGFRGSRSKYFVEKRDEYAQGGGLSLKLTKNFRSSDKVLDAVNSLFCKIMTKNTSSVAYAEDSVMLKGGRYPEGCGEFLAHILNTEADKKTKKEAELEAKNELLPVYSVREAYRKLEREHIKTAELLKQIIDESLGSEFFDVEEGKVRPVRYGDIVILSRKNQGEIKGITLELSDMGVPVTSSAAVNICEYAEVKTLIDILSLIDNERQDEPLVTALLSALGGDKTTGADIDVNDLAEIRLAYKEEKFFRDACKRYAEEQSNRLSGKLSKFYSELKRLRSLAFVTTAGEVLNELLSSTTMEVQILSRENGVSCLRRVRRFIAESVTPEPLTVHEFLNRLKNLSYEIEYSESGGENSVQIMTMHSSKGLEFPVVIVDATGNFRGADRQEVVLEEEYGLAPRAYDAVNMTKRSTLLRKLYEERKKRDEVGDELNLYYVAMTRAKYALHVVFKDEPIFCDVPYAGSFAELTDFSTWGRISRGVKPTIEKQEKEVEGGSANKELVEKIVNGFSPKYPYAGVENLPVKSSATSIMKEGNVLEEEHYPSHDLFDDAEDEAEGVELDRFEQTGKERGIAYHAFLENFDFSSLPMGAGARESLLSSVDEALFAQRESGALSPDQLALLDREKLADILSIPVFAQLKGARLYKEQQFLASLPIRDVPIMRERALNARKESFGDDGGANIAEEELLFQGAIDLLALREDGTVWIVDYKYSRKGAESLKKKYARQLALYKKVTARILKVDEEKIRCTIVNLLRGFEVETE